MSLYDARARLVFHFAREEGERLGHPVVGPEHLLLGVLRAGGEATRVLGAFGVTLGGARQQVVERADYGEGSPSEATLTPSTRRIFELASAEAHKLGSLRVRTEHLLLALMQEQEGATYDILQEFIQDVEALRRQFMPPRLPD